MTTETIKTIAIKDSVFELLFRAEVGSEWRWVGTPDCGLLIPYRKGDPYRAVAALVLYELFDFHAARNKGWLKLTRGDLSFLIEKLHYFVREFEASLG